MITTIKVRPETRRQVRLLAAKLDVQMDRAVAMAVQHFQKFLDERGIEVGEIQ